MDMSEQHQTDVQHNIYKSRLNPDGTSVNERPDKHGLGRNDAKPVSVRDPEYCGSCYGAMPDGFCCNTCEDVREAYRKKGWSVSAANEIEQVCFWLFLLIVVFV